MRKLNWRTRLKQLLYILLLAGAAAAILVELTSLRCFQLIGDVTCRVATERKAVALTFSGGLTREGISPILRSLASADANATFFLRGDEITRLPATVRAIQDSGNEIGSQGYHYVKLVDLTQEFYSDTIAKADSALADAGAEKTSLFRPPFGQKSVGLIWELQKRDRRIILWDVSDAGIRGATPQSYASSIVSRAKPGSIIALRAMDEKDTVAREALPLILQGLKERGFEIVTVSDLLESGRG